MTKTTTDNKTANRREYYRKWRAEHPERVRAAQMRYWLKKAVRFQSAGRANSPGLPDGVEIRTGGEMLNR